MIRSNLNFIGLQVKKKKAGEGGNGRSEKIIVIEVCLIVSGS